MKVGDVIRYKGGLQNDHDVLNNNWTIPEDGELLFDVARIDDKIFNGDGMAWIWIRSKNVFGYHNCLPSSVIERHFDPEHKEFNDKIENLLK